MKIVLATGIYPPDIGGPATYTRALAEKLHARGHEVVVVTYGISQRDEPWALKMVSRRLPLLRWCWYARTLRNVAVDADVVYAFSSVSVGIPLIFAGLKKPKKILRLGGDFLWERYTDCGGRKTLRSFYDAYHKKPLMMAMRWLLQQFDHIVFSTEFQQKIYEDSMKTLPEHGVIENAIEVPQRVEDTAMRPHTPFRLLFMGRFVAFKNCTSLIEAVAHVPACTLTLVGEGPCAHTLKRLVERLGLSGRIQFCAPVHGKEKIDMFQSHDLLVLSSITEISPNIALEAHAVGLPVLLSDQTGLSDRLRLGMHIARMQEPREIVSALNDVLSQYPSSVSASQTIQERSWDDVCDDHMRLFA